MDLSKFIAELNASGESLLIYNGSNITMDTEGNIGIVSNMNTLYMVDANGMLLSRTECPDKYEQNRNGICYQCRKLVYCVWWYELW